jgi:hypothetical protein
MKLQATKQTFKGERVLWVGYCKLQYLLMQNKPFAYSSGVYGWACDYYDLGDGFYISTGYNPIGVGKNETYEICKRYDTLASEIKSIDYTERMEQLNQLQLAFAKEIKSVLGW